MGPPFITAEWGGCRGQQDYRPGRTASMGPPFITAEWVGRHRCGAAGRSGFNGAAVHHGGVGPTPPAAACSDRGFNGAAVHHGGVGCRDPSPSCRRLLASMGPPFITAEWHRRVDDEVHAVDHASMGPPFITAEWYRRRL